MKKKLFTLCLAAVLAATAVIGGTLAYFTDSDDAVNTFTVGKVKLILDEADVNEKGEVISEDRVDENNYHLIPGHSYTKDPTVTVKGGSEPSYVRMLVTLNKLAELKDIFGDSFLPQNYVEDTWDSSIWPCAGMESDEEANTVTYEFRYYQTVDTLDGEDDPLEPLFEKIAVPGSVTGEDLAKLGDATPDDGVDDSFKVSIVAQAIQKDGFDSADEAWAAMDAQ